MGVANSVNSTIYQNNFLVQGTTSGSTVTSTVSNSSNNASSSAANHISVGGGTSDDAYMRFAVGTTAQYALGIDNSDSDKFKLSYATSGATPSSATNIMAIDSSGNVSWPVQPCFLAVLGTTTGAVTGDGTGYAIVFDTEKYDVGANFASSVFTAPVTGQYALGFSFGAEGITNQGAFQSFITTTSQTLYTSYGSAQALGGFGFMGKFGSVVLKLTAADQASFTITFSSGTKGVKAAGAVSSTTWAYAYLLS